MLNLKLNLKSLNIVIKVAMLLTTRLLKWQQINISKCHLYTLIIFNIIYPSISSASIDHKNSQLNLYLDQISENQDEKTGIIDIIKKHRSGSYLDIGSGRDTISHILNNLSTYEVDHVNLIVADLEGKTLTEIAKRYPKLYLNLENRSNIDLSLVKMDATEMHYIKDSSIKAINASALLHEINSYVSPKSPVDRFFGESIRILEKNGFLIYRDPTLQSNPDIVNFLVIKNDFTKKFISIFLPKFLDNDLTQIVDMYGHSIKPNFHYQDKFTINLSVIGNDKPITLNYHEFFNLQSR